MKRPLALAFIFLLIVQSSTAVLSSETENPALRLLTESEMELLMRRNFFEIAVAVVLFHETSGRIDGAYTCRPDDPGGPTKWGITLPFLKQYAGADYPPDHTFTSADIQALTYEQAAELYRRYWVHLGLDVIAEPLVAVKVFDMAVNEYEKHAFETVQSALNRLGATPPLDVDGSFGPRTVAALNGQPAGRSLWAIRIQLEAYYKGIVEKNPAKKVFLNGWLDRAFQ